MAEEGVERVKFKAKIYNLKKGTTLFSGPYPEYGEVIGHVEEKGLKTNVFTDEKLKRISTAGWVFFPTTHTVEIDEDREVKAWIAKMPGKGKGFVKI